MWRKRTTSASATMSAFSESSNDSRRSFGGRKEERKSEQAVSWIKPVVATSATPASNSNCLLDNLEDSLRLLLSQIEKIILKAINHGKCVDQVHLDRMNMATSWILNACRSPSSSSSSFVTSLSSSSSSSNMLLRLSSQRDKGVILGQMKSNLEVVTHEIHSFVNSSYPGGTLTISSMCSELKCLLDALASRLGQNRSLDVAKDDLFILACKSLFAQCFRFWSLAVAVSAARSCVADLEACILELLESCLDRFCYGTGSKILDAIIKRDLPFAIENIRLLSPSMFTNGGGKKSGSSSRRNSFDNTIKPTTVQLEEELIMTEFLEQGMLLLKSLKDGDSADPQHRRSVATKFKLLSQQLLPVLNDKSPAFADLVAKSRQFGMNSVSDVSISLVMDMLNLSNGLIKQRISSSDGGGKLTSNNQGGKVSSMLGLGVAREFVVSEDCNSSVHSDSSVFDSDLNMDECLAEEDDNLSSVFHSHYSSLDERSIVAMQMKKCFESGGGGGGNGTVATSNSSSINGKRRKSPTSSGGQPPLQSRLKNTFFTTDLSLLNRKESFKNLASLPSTLKYGTLTRLIERLTFIPKQSASSPVLNHIVFQKALIVSHYNFTDSRTLLEMLLERYQCKFDAPGFTSNRIVSSIRLQTLHFIKLWMDLQIADFMDRNGALMTTLRAFIDDQVIRVFPKAATSIIKLMELQSIERSSYGIPPQPILPKMNGGGSNSNNFVLQMDPLEIARQMTLLDQEVFQKVRFRMFFEQPQDDDDYDDDEVKDGSEQLDPINGMVQRFNFITQWVISIILSCAGAKERSLVLKHLISVAEKLWQLRNYHGLSAIMGSLTSAPVHRLKESWSLVPKKTMSLMNDLGQLVSADCNYQRFRHQLDEAISCNSACIPWLGLYLKDLVFIQDAQKTFLDIPAKPASPTATTSSSPFPQPLANPIAASRNVINFSKCQMILPVMQAIAEFQRHRYPFISIQAIQEFLTRDWGMWKSDEEQFERSLLIEPRRVK